MDIRRNFRNPPACKSDGFAVVVLKGLGAELEHQEGETLTDVVVKLSRDPRKFLFLSFDQLAVHRGKRVPRFHRRLLADEPSVLLFRSFPFRDDGRQCESGHRQHDEENVEEHRVERNGVFPAKGPKPSAVNTVASAAVQNTVSVAPPTPKPMAPHITNGSTANARMPFRIAETCQSPKMTKQATVSSVTSVANSKARARDGTCHTNGVNVIGVTSSTPVLSPSQ